MHRILCTLLLLANSFQSIAQKMAMVYLNSSDSAASNYLVVYPDKSPWKGYLLLLPSFGESPAHVLTQTMLPAYAAQHGLLTIIPTLSTGITSFGIDSVSQSSLAAIIHDAASRYKLINLPMYIGGFSVGGSCAVKYAEEASTNPKLIKPAAVFAIDPPLDFERFYNSSVRSIRLAGNNAPPQEAAYMKARMEQEMKGTPGTALQAYRNLSPYSYSDTSQLAIKLLMATPILLFTEPDVDWWMQNRGTDFTGMNSTDCAAMINELQRLDNNNAMLKTTLGKGFREPGHVRHPHSWSIAGPEVVVDWLVKFK